LLLSAIFVIVWIRIAQNCFGEYEGYSPPQCTASFYVDFNSPTDPQFIWMPQFFSLIIVNLLIFFGIWLLPMLVLARRMRQSKAYIVPVIVHLENVLRSERQNIIN